MQATDLIAATLLVNLRLFKLQQLKGVSLHNLIKTILNLESEFRGARRP